MKTRPCSSSILGRAFACVTLLLLSVVVWTPSLSAQVNLITNGAFDMGDTGFQSQYANNQLSAGAGQYAIGTDPSRYSSGYAAFFDHTGNHGDMLIGKGSLTLDQSIWTQTVSGLVPGSDYTFRLFAATDWGSNPGTQNPAVLQLATDSTRIGTPTTLPLAAGQFIAITATFTAIGSSQILQVFDNNVSSSFNDFAIDDLSLVQVVPEPSAAIAVLGSMAVVGVMFIKRRSLRLPACHRAERV